MDLTTATPVEIDTALAEIYSRLYKVWDALDVNATHIKDVEKGLVKYREGNRSYSSYTQEALDRLEAKRADLQAEASQIRAETLPYDAEYTRRGGWTRFFLVQNNGGHIHSSTACSTCFPTTRFGWLPQESGQDEAAAVAAHGAILCTVCFPSAPVEWTKGKVDLDQCAGSGQYFDSSLPIRVGYYSGNWATCTGCGERVTVTKTGKFRKHKKA